MRKRKRELPISVLEELRALEHIPPKTANRLIARHLRGKKSLELSKAVAEAARRSSNNPAPALEAPSELLPPLA
jgi:hypothetical protein